MLSGAGGSKGQMNDCPRRYTDKESGLTLSFNFSENPRQKWRGFCFLVLLESPDGFVGQVRRQPPPDKNAGTMRKAGLSLTPTFSHKVRYFICIKLII
ncbi:hypothetical protein ACMYSL_03590 [Klebsiella sp. MISC125]|uniref:hypothetical protein n=1 Tax=Klebsiella sp. MISC125 TaxID=2755386 RepID=UPI003DA8A9D0